MPRLQGIKQNRNDCLQPPLHIKQHESYDEIYDRNNHKGDADEFIEHGVCLLQ